ncbi:uncharacterized protein HKW66_Vig0217140 [Vigna angularis]|uniref:Uncharacterized protein n=1 Tax=Phaseolus angularis TaxID=3914 RepID=A0A8T0JH89_PHAAN|nr:uncharacterized protein HKW66_Vig0217140 [Vigna angularis]
MVVPWSRILKSFISATVKLSPCPFRVVDEINQGGITLSITRFALASTSFFASDLTLSAVILCIERSSSRNSFTTRFSSANASSFLSAYASVFVSAAFNRSDSFSDLFFDLSSFSAWLATKLKSPTFPSSCHAGNSDSGRCRRS